MAESPSALPPESANGSANSKDYVRPSVSDPNEVRIVDTREPGSARVPAALRTAAAWAWRLAAVTIAIAIAGWVITKVTLLLIVVLVALLLAVIAEPVVSFLKRRWNWPPAAAAAATLILILVLLGALIGGSGTGLYQGFSQLGDNISNGIETVVDWSRQAFPSIYERFNIDTALAEAQTTLSNNSSTILGGVLNIGSSIGAFFAGLVLTFFTLFFFLKDGRRMWHWFVRLLPASYRNNANEAGIRAWVTLGNYTRTQAIVALVDAVGIGLIAVILGTPLSLAFPVAALVFVGAFIPIVGALLSGSISVLVVLVNTGSWVMALVMLGGVLLVQQVEGHLLQPLLQGNALNMHALAIVLLVTGGSALAGIAGALFTVPIAAAINSTVLYLGGHDIYPYLNDMENRPGGPKRDFSEYSEEYWTYFNEHVAQKLPPREARKQAKISKAIARVAQRANPQNQSE